MFSHIQFLIQQKIILGQWSTYIQILATLYNFHHHHATHGYHQIVNTEIRLMIFFEAKDGEALYSQQKEDQELTVAQIMKSLLPNSDLNWRK